jgi:hypothetical protein
MHGCYGHNLVYVENLLAGGGGVVRGLPSHIWENNIVVQLEGLGGVRSLRFWICLHLARGKIPDAASCELGDASELHRNRVSWPDNRV